MREFTAKCWRALFLRSSTAGAQLCEHLYFSSCRSRTCRSIAPVSRSRLQTGSLLFHPGEPSRLRPELLHRSLGFQMYKLICLLTLVPFAMGQSLNVADHSASDSPLSFPQAKVEPGPAGQLCSLQMYNNNSHGLV